MAARTNLAQYWKRETLLMISDWKSKCGEQAAIASLTMYIYKEIQPAKTVSHYTILNSRANLDIWNMGSNKCSNNL